MVQGKQTNLSCHLKAAKANNLKFCKIIIKACAGVKKFSKSLILSGIACFWKEKNVS